MTEDRPIDVPRRRRSRRWRAGALLSAGAASLLMSACFPPASSAGSLDTTYSGDGVATYQDGTGEARASVQQPDGKTVVAGWGYWPDNSPSLRAVYVARYDTAGQADPGFGSGMAKVDVASGAEVVRSVAVDSSGRVVVLGTIPAADYPDESEVFVLRLTAAGQLDSTFDGDGILIIDRSNHDRAGDIVATGNRLLLAGSFDADGSWANQWTILALGETGGLDATFTGDGVATVPTAKVSEFDRLRSLVVQPDGKLVLGGSDNNEFTVVRLLTDGNLDTTWDGDGVARTLVGTTGEGNTVLVQPDGRVVLAGHAGPGGGRPDDDMAVVRWTATGVLDNGFDGDGKVLVDFGRQENDRAYGASLAADAKIVLGGFAYTATGMDLAVARLNHNGTLDTSFSDDGRNTTNFGNGANEEIESVTVGLNGRVLGAGWYHDRWLIAGYDGGANERITVSDVSVTEPDAGTVDAVFTISLSSSWGSPVTVRYSTANGSATAPGDYGSRSGTVTFAPGETTKTVSVPVAGDTAAEGNEQFQLNLSLPTNAGITDGSAVATIVNDD